jgi:8-oxo-dGTP diphosphatase
MDPDDKQFGRVWHFPGGSLEFGETVEQSLKREIKEETQLEILILKQITPVYSAVRDNWHGLLIPHLCEVVGTPNIVLNDESYQYGWYTPHEIRGLKKLPFVQEMADAAEALLI